MNTTQRNLVRSLRSTETQLTEEKIISIERAHYLAQDLTINAIEHMLYDRGITHQDLEDSHPSAVLLRKFLEDKGWSNSILDGLGKRYEFNNQIIYNVNSLFNLLVNKRKSAKHRICNEFLRTHEKQWDRLYFTNTNKDMDKLHKLFNSLNIKHPGLTVPKSVRKLKYTHHDHLKRTFQFEPQMFTNIYNMPSKFNDMCDNFVTTSQSFYKVSENVDAFLNKWSEISNNTTQALRNIENDVCIYDFFIWVSKCISFAYIISQPENQTLTRVTSLIIMIMPTSSGIMDLGSCLSRAIMGIIDYFSGSFQTQDNSSGAESFVSTLFDITRGLLRNAFSALPDNEYQQIFYKTQKVKMLAGLIKNCTTIYEFFQKVISGIIDIITYLLTRYISSIPIKTDSAELNELFDLYTKYKVENWSRYCTYDINYAKRVISLRERFIKVTQLYNQESTRYNRFYPIAPMLSLVNRDLDEVYACIPAHFYSHGESHRSKPYWFNISGPPRIGKSKIIQPILVNHLAHRLGLIKEYQDPQHYCCYRTCGSEYWDGAQGAKVIWYNDLLQSIKDEKLIDGVVTELTQVIDDNPYVMNMAYCTLKGQCLLTASLVASNTQNPLSHAEHCLSRTWSKGAHILQRLNIAIHMEVCEHYKRPDGSINYNAVNESTNLWKNLFPRDMYIFKILSPLDANHVIFETTIEGLLRYIDNDVDKYMNKQATIDAKLDSYMKNTWETQIFTEYYNKFRDFFYSKHTEDLTEVFYDAPNILYTGNINPEFGIAVNNVLNNIIDNTNSEFIALFTYCLRLGAEYFELNGCTPMSFQDLMIRRINTFTKKNFFLTDDQRNYILNQTASGNYENYVHVYLSSSAISTAYACIQLYYGLIPTHIICQILREVVPINGLDTLYSFYVNFTTNHPWCTSLFQFYLFINFSNKPSFLRLLGEFSFACMHRTDLIIDKLLEWIIDNYNEQYEAQLVYDLFNAGAHNAIEELLSVLGVNTEEEIDFGYRRYMLHNHPDKVLENERAEATQRSAHVISLMHTYRVYKENRDKINKSTFEFWKKVLFVGNIAIPYIKIFKNYLMYFGIILGALKIGTALYDTCMRTPTKPQTHEGKQTYRRTVYRRPNKINVVPQIRNNTNTDIENILTKSYFNLAFEYERGGQYHNEANGACLNFAADLVICPYHYWAKFSQLYKKCSAHGIRTRLKITFKNRTPIYYNMRDVEVRKLDAPHLADVIFLRFKNTFMGRNIMKFFVSESDEPSLSGCYLFGYRMINSDFPDVVHTQPVYNVYVDSKTYYTAEGTDSIVHEPYFKETIQYGACFIYSGVATQPGDCAQVLMHTDHTLQSRKIIGFHTAGSPVQCVGLSCMIFFEDLKFITEQFGDFYDIPIIDTQPVDDTLETQMLEQAGVTVLGHLRKYNITKEYTTPIMVPKQYKVNIVLPMKTKISKSLVYDNFEQQYGPSLLGVSRLRPFTNSDGEKIYPYFKNIKKFLKFSSPPDIDHHPTIMSDICYEHNRVISPWQNNRRLLTLDEAINGIDGYNAIDMTTSPGFPYVVLANGKKAFFVRCGDKYVPGDFLQECIDKRLDDLNNGYITDTIFVDCLKDEKRTLDRVAQGKTRIFQVAPMDYNIILRIYFGAFLAMSQTSYATGEDSMGINPNSLDWTHLYHRIINRSRKVSDCDGESWDATLSIFLGVAYADSVSDWYDDGDANRRIRRLLCLTFLVGNHIVYDIIYWSFQGNKSGTSVTTSFNCYCNKYLNRYAYLKLVAPDLSKFRENVTQVFFGDDKLQAIVDTIIDKYNNKTMKDVLSTVGITLTSADKHSDLQEYRDIDDVQYLKRKFVLGKYGIVHAPLAKELILEIPRWSECDPTSMPDQLNRFNSSLIEMSHYGHDEFDIYRSFCIRCGNDLNRDGYTFETCKLFTYDYCMYLMYPTIYTEDKFLNDLTTGREQDIVVLRRETSNRNVLKILNKLQHHTFSAEDDVFASTTETQMNTIKFDDNFFTEEEERVIASRCDRITSCLLDIFSGLFSDFESPFSASLMRAFRVNFIKSLQRKLIDCELQPQMNTEHETGVVSTNTNATTVNERETYALDLPETIVTSRKAQVNIQNDGTITTLRNIISTPVQIVTIKWSSTDVVGFKLSELFFPYALTQASSPLRYHLDHYTYWAPDIEIKVTINSTSNMYGRIVCAWIPQAQALNASYKEFNCMYGNNWVQVDAGGANVVSMRVPYTHYREYLPLCGDSIKAVDLGKAYDLFTFYMFVAIPLRSVNGSAVSTSISVAARVIEPRLLGYTPAHFVSQMNTVNSIERGRPGAQEASVTQDAPLSDTGVYRPGDYVRSIIPIPEIGKTISAVSKSAAELGKRLEEAGFNIEPNLKRPTPVINQLETFGQFDNTVDEVPLGGSVVGLVTKDFDAVNSYPTEMCITDYCARPYLISSGAIESTHKTGSVIFRRAVTPRAMFYQGYGVASSNTINNSGSISIYPSHLYFASSFADMWRGGIRFHISFCASIYHSCRVKIMWVPWMSPNLTSAAHHLIDLANNEYSHGVTVDITKNTEVSFTVPYMGPFEWRYMSRNAVFGSGNSTADVYPGNTYANGYLVMYVIQELCSAETSIQPVSFQVFCSAASDFQLAYNNNTDTKNICQFSPQMNDINAPYSGYSASSSEQLQNITYPSITGDHSGYRIKNHSTSAEIVSFKQLTNMMSYYYATKLTASVAYSTRIGFFSTSGSTTPMKFNAMMRASLGFRYWRGGVRSRIITPNYTINFMSFLQTDIEPGDKTVITANTDILKTTNGFTGFTDAPGNSDLYNQNSFNYKAPNNNARINVVVPWTSVFKCNSINHFGAKAPTYTETSVVYGSTYLWVGYASDFYMYMGGCDDFLLGFQIGLPRMTKMQPPNKTEWNFSVAKRSLDDQISEDDIENMSVPDFVKLSSKVIQNPSILTYLPRKDNESMQYICMVSVLIDEVVQKYGYEFYKDLMSGNITRTSTSDQNLYQEIKTVTQKPEVNEYTASQLTTAGFEEYFGKLPERIDQMTPEKQQKLHDFAKDLKWNVNELFERIKTEQQRQTTEPDRSSVGVKIKSLQESAEEDAEAFLRKHK